MAGYQRQGFARQPGALVDALPRQSLAPEPLRQPGYFQFPAQPVALAAASAPGRAGAAAREGAIGLLGAFGLQRAAADSGGALAGIVRAGGHAAHCRWAPGSQAAPVVSGAPAGAGDAGLGELLAQYLRRSEEGFERKIPQALLAGRPLGGRTHRPDQTPQVGRVQIKCESWLACDTDDSVYRVHRGDAIAGKPAPTQASFPQSVKCGLLRGREQEPGDHG